MTSMLKWPQIDALSAWVGRRHWQAVHQKQALMTINKNYQYKSAVHR